MFEDGLGLLFFPAASLVDPSGVNGRQTIPVSLVPLAPFRLANEAYGSALGAQIYYHQNIHITIEEEEEIQAGAFAFRSA